MAKKWFRVLEGKHTDAKGTTHLKGAKFASELELDKMFQGSFERLDNVVEVMVVQSPAEVVEETAPVKEPEVDGDDEGKKESNDPRGRDVTDKYEIAGEHDWSVFKNGDVWNVYNHAVLMNSKPLKKKGDVVAFLEAEAAKVEGN